MFVLLIWIVMLVIVVWVGGWVVRLCGVVRMWFCFLCGCCWNLVVGIGRCGFMICLVLCRCWVVVGFLFWLVCL